MIRASNGYRIGVSANPAPRKGRPDEVSVVIAGKSGYVTYTAPAILDGEGIQADLGDLGTINMSWQPNGHVRRLPLKCREYRSAVYVAGGAYRGAVRITGENGFTTAAATEAKGQTGWYRFGCGYTVNEGFPGPGLLLDAYTDDPQPADTYRYLSVVQNHRHGEVSFLAGMGERKGRVSVDFRAYASGRAKTLTFDGHFDSTAITPPPPFTGTGIYERIAKRKPGTWKGDLTVDFPGREDVPLAGEDFAATFKSGFRESEAGRTHRVFIR